jgi:hypothetical protein
MAPLRLETGEDVVLAQVLARAGEGTIYALVDHPEWVAKIFHPTLKRLGAKLEKVAAMVASPPEEAEQRSDFVVLTWPLHVLESDDGAVGYVMPRVDMATAVEIHTLSNPSNRANPLPSAPQWTKAATWIHLVNIAANLCIATDAAHRMGAVIGDFQERNILVSDTTRVTLVDCDSMQFTDSAGRQFLCGVGRPEFTAPELAHANLRTTAREIASDLFSLAVHVHLLLMAGNHPFMRGTWIGDGDQPDALTLAKAGHWAGGWNSPLHTHPLAPPVTFLPVDIQQLFNRALTTGAHDPALRPSAAEWRAALQRVTTTSCVNGAHQIPTGCAVCPWCAIDTERMTRKRRRGPAAYESVRQSAPIAAPTPALLRPGVLAKVVARDDDLYGKVGKVVEISHDDDDDLDVIVQFPDDSEVYAFGRAELSVASPAERQQMPSTTVTSKDFWSNVGIDPIRIITSDGSFLTLRCYLDDAPIFLGSGGRIDVFRSGRLLRQYVADNRANDLDALSTYRDVVLAATNGSLRADRVEAFNVYLIRGLGEDIGAGPKDVDPDQLALAVELLEDVGKYLQLTVVDDCLHDGQPLGAFVKAVLNHTQTRKARELARDAVQQWTHLETLLNSRLRVN